MATSIDAVSSRAQRVLRSAQQVRPDDKRISAKHVEFASPRGHGKARGYPARPANAGDPLPVVLVIHENRGLNPHIEDIARRLALENFIAFAPDALPPRPGGARLRCSIAR